MKRIGIVSVCLLLLIGCAPTVDDVRKYGEEQFVADVLAVTNGARPPERLIEKFKPLRIEPHLRGAWLIIEESSRYQTGIYVDPESLDGWGGSGMEIAPWTDRIGLSKETRR